MVKSRPCQNGACSRGDALLPLSEGREDDELDAEEDVCALCKVHCSYPGMSAEPASEDSLALAYGGWCGPRRDQLAGGVSRRVQAFLQARATVLHCDDIINKKDPVQVGYLLQKLLQHRSPVQVAFLQGAIPLQNTVLFPRLLDFLQLCPVWSAPRHVERRRLGRARPRRRGLHSSAAACTLPPLPHPFTHPSTQPLTPLPSSPPPRPLRRPPHHRPHRSP